MSRDYTEITDEQLRTINKRAIEQPSYEQLREQNRVLREALQAVHHAWLTKPNNQEIDGFHFWYSAHIEQVEVALTATSQPAKPAGKMHACDIPGCVSCGNPEDATSQEGQHG